MSVEDYRRSQGQATGRALVDLLQKSPLGEIEIVRTRTPARVRRVKL